MDESTQPGLVATLTVLEGARSPLTLTVSRFPALIGRSDDCEVCLEEAPGQTTLSRRHARLSLARGRLHLEDLSTNGTTVGRRLLSAGETRALADSEEVWFGPKVRVRIDTLRPNSPLPAPEPLAPSRANGEAPLQLRTLGAFQAGWGDQPLADEVWETRKPMLLLAYLAWHQPRAISAERVCNDLWPDNAQGGRQALQSTLARVRRALRPADPVLFERGSYRLHPQLQCSCDANLLQQEARAAGASSQPDQQVVHLERVRALYQGPFLEGFSDDWVCLRRQDLEQLYLGCMADLGALLNQRGAPRQALDLFRQVLELEPCWEPGHQGTVRSLVELGQRDEAVRHYHRYVETMKTHLSLAASPEMLRLYYSLLEPS